jgi:hypothetical protein
MKRTRENPDPDCGGDYGDGTAYCANHSPDDDQTCREACADAGEPFVPLPFRERSPNARPSDAPRPALGELARTATAVIDAEAEQARHPYGSLERAQAARATVNARHAFYAAATPSAVLQLVALATGGAEDTARLDWLETMPSTVHLSTGKDRRNYTAWPVFDASKLREAIDAARSLTPSSQL